MVPPIYNLVLAAGAGRRLAVLTGTTPKQFWRPDGQRSLLDDTLSRISPIAPPARTVTVVDRTHHPFVASHVRPSSLGQVIYQPGDRGTAAGVLFGLTAIARIAPRAVVMMTPSDQGVDRDDVFRHGLLEAIDEVRSGSHEVVLFGVEPDQPDGDYGWISPAGRSATDRIRRVAEFVEKPAAIDAERLLTQGAVWNTMVLVGTVRALLSLYRRHLPLLHDAFDSLAIDHAASHAVLRDRYHALPHLDFSRDLLTPANDLSLFVWPSAMGWSDLGTPERLLAWQSRLASPRAMSETAA